jgi:hypothetical protein
VRLIPGLFNRLERFVLAGRIEIQLSGTDFDFAYLRAFHFLKRLANTRHASLAMHPGDFDSHSTILDGTERQTTQCEANLAKRTS